MTRSDDRWRDARRALDGLGRWYAGRDRADADPLAALGGIGVVRRLLDEAELEAVRSARRLDRSWAEIATRLGVSRQSAWERWRDLDGAGGSGPAAGTAPLGEVAAEEPLSLGELAAPDGPEPRRSRSGRRRVAVPDVVGLTFLDARLRLAGRDLVGILHDLAADPDPEAAVTGQIPDPGARVPRGTPVRLWIDRDGDAGVREPRRPPPATLTGRKAVDDVEEAVDRAGSPRRATS